MGGTPTGPERSPDTGGSPNTGTAAEEPVNTPSLRNCERTELPKPSRTDGGLQPRSYPEYPGSFNRSELEEYATSFEKSYRHNDFLRTSPAEYDELTVRSGVADVSETGRKFQMRVEGTILFSDEERTTDSTATPYPSGRAPFVAWFLFDEEFALRDGRDTGYTDDLAPDFSNADVIVCP